MNRGKISENRNSAEYCALAILALEGRHGYDVFKELRWRLGLIFKIGRSQVYALLKNLERDGLITHMKVQQENVPSKKVYSITAEGSAALEEWLGEPAPSVRDLRVDFLTKVYFSRLLSTDRGAGLLIEQKKVLHEKRMRIRRWRQSAGQRTERDALDYKEKMVDTALEWLEGVSND